MRVLLLGLDDFIDSEVGWGGVERSILINQLTLTQQSKALSRKKRVQPI